MQFVAKLFLGSTFPNIITTKLLFRNYFCAMTELILKDESYTIIGKCIEVHKQLGFGFREIVYKDALEYECKLQSLVYEREKKYEISYKGFILPHHFYADFIYFPFKNMI